MKVIKFFAITAMAAAMITSCSNEDELSQSNYPSDNIIRVTAGVNNAKTRAEGAGTPLENPLSLTVVNKNVPKYTYVDQEFSKTSGDWACSETLLWQKSDALVDIVAFAPAQQGKFNGVYANGSIQPIANIAWLTTSLQSQTITTCCTIMQKTSTLAKVSTKGS